MVREMRLENGNWKKKKVMRKERGIKEQ